MTAKSNFDGDQLEKLKVWFDINPTPSKAQVDHIAAQIKVSPSAQVWMWFHRQRNRAKINNNISPAKTSIKGSRSSDQHMHKVKTGPLTKRLDCNGNTGDCLERLNGAEGCQQDRVRSKKVHIRGILRDPQARQQSGRRTAEESLKHMLKGSERRQHERVKFNTGDEVNTVNKTNSINNLEQERIRSSINRTDRRVDPQECIRTESGQNCSKRKEKKLPDSVKHKRTSSLPGFFENNERNVDAQRLHPTEPPQQRIKKMAKEADSQRQPLMKPSPVGISRTVMEKESNVKITQEFTRKILKEADSQKHVSNQPFQQGMNKRDKVAKHLVQNRSESLQYCSNSADKVSDKKPRSFSQLDKERLLRHDKSAHRLKTDVVPKRITPDDNISVINGVQVRGKVPQEKRQIEVNTPSATNRVLEEEKSIPKRPVECQRKVTEHPSVHQKAGGKRVKQRHQVRNIPPSVRKKKPKPKHKVPKEIRMHWLLSGKPKPSANRVKNVKETKVSQEKPQSKREMQAKPNACRTGIFSTLSLPQGKVTTNLSDSSDEDDFEDDQNKRMHQLNIKKTCKTGSSGNGVSIPVISRTRREGTLADCSNRSAAGKNLRRIPLKSTKEVQSEDSPVSQLSCEVSSTSTSQSSVISSTVEEVHVGDPSHSSKACPKSLDSPDRDSCEIAVRITERSRREGKEHMENQKFEKRTAPVISDDKMVVQQDTKYRFKKELSVNLLKINLSSLSDKREVTVSSKMNQSRQGKKRKGGSPPCRDDMTDKNSSVLVDFSGGPKSAERSLWSSFATPIETSNKVWSAIASSAQTPHKEIPFMETPASIDMNLNKFWSSVASSPEMPHKEIPFIESSSLEGDSTPTSSQDCLERNEGQNRPNEESIFDEDSCEVSSSVDLEKTQTDLTEIVGETEKTSSVVSKKNKDEVRENTVDVMEATQDVQKTPEESMDIEQTSACVEKNRKGSEKTSADLEESKDEVDTFVVPKKYMNEVKKTSANLGDNFEQLDNTESEESDKVQVEHAGIVDEPEKTAEDTTETAGEVHKAPTEETEKAKISEGKKENESDKEQGSELQDIYEDINSPDYDMDVPFIVLDEVGCSDTEGSSVESSDPSSELASPVPRNVVNSPKTEEVIDLDTFSYNDDVIMVSSTAAKQPRSRIPSQKPLKDHSVCNGKQVGQGEPSCALKTTKKDGSPVVIELDYCSEDDEVILLTLSPEPSKSADVSVNKISELSNIEPAKDSPNCLQNKEHSNSVTQENSIEKESMTAVQETLSVEEDLSIKSPSVSKIKTSDPIDRDSSSISDAEIEIDKLESSSSVLQADEHPKSEEILKDSAELAFPQETQVDSEEEVIHGTEEMCLIKNVVSLSNQSVAEEDLADVMQSRLEVEKEDVTLEMICDTIPNKSNAIDDQKLADTLNTSKQNAGCTEFTSSDELDIDMETCDEIESFLQGKDVVKENCASTSEIVKVDAIEESSRCNESTSEEELVIDMEACHQIESPHLEKEESKDTSATPSDPPTEKPDTTDRNKRRIDSALSDELIIDMEACNEKERDDSKDVGASSIKDDIEHKDSFKASNVVIMTCNSETRRNAGEDLQATEDMVLSGQDSGHKEFESSDELVIDEKTLFPPQEEDASKQNMGCYNSTSSDELVIDQKPCLEMQSPCKENDTSESNSASEQNVEPPDSVSSEEPIIDEKAFVETQSPPQEKDASEDTGASEQNVGLSDYASADELIIDEKPCLETQSPPQERDASEDNCVSEQIVGCLDFNSSDKLRRDDDACDETKCPNQENDVSDDKCTNPSEAVKAEIYPSHKNSGPENLESKELSAEATSCEQAKCTFPENNASYSSEQDVSCEVLAYNKCSMVMSSCDQTDLEADAATEKDVDASPVRDFTEQAEQKEDSMSSDEEDVDVTTYSETESSGAVALLENSSMTIKRKALSPDDVKRSKAVADVLDQDSVAEVTMTSSRNSPFDKGSTGIDFANVTETDLLPSTNPTLSSDVALPLEDQANVGKKGSPPSNAGTTCMALSTNLDAEEISREVLTSSECNMNTTAAPDQTEPNTDAAMKSTCTNKNSSPSTSPVAPSLEPQGISPVVFDTITSQKEKSSTVRDAYVCGYTCGLNAVASPNAEDLQAMSSLTTNSTSHRLPNTVIKTEPDVAAKKRCQSGTNSPRLDPSPSKLDNSTERSKRPKSLTELVSDLTQRLTTLSKAATQTSTAKSLDLPYSSVSINRNAQYSTKSSSSSAEATPQPPKPTPQSRRGSKRRIITNKNFKRPALSEEVQRRIQQLNPYPCDNSWMRNAAVVELAQKEVELHCQPGETGSTKDPALEAHMESSHEPVLSPPGTSGLNFCYQPGIGPIKGDTRGPRDRDSHSTDHADPRCATESGSHSPIHGNSRGVTDRGSHSTVQEDTRGATDIGSESTNHAGSRGATDKGSVSMVHAHSRHATDRGSHSTVHTDSRCATDKDSQSTITTSRIANTGNHRVEVQPSSDLTNLEHMINFNATNSELRPSSDLTSLEHFTTFNSTNSGHVTVDHSKNSKKSTTVTKHPQLDFLLKNVIPGSMLMKRSKTHSGLSETKKKKRRRRKSSTDICSERKRPIKRIISEKDIREEWMHLLDDLEGNKEQPNSETIDPALSTATASEGDPSYSTGTASEGHPSSSTATASEGDPSSSTTVPVEGISPAASDNTEASLEALRTSSNALISEVDNLSDMPSILRVYSLRDEEEGGQESSPPLGDHGLGSFDFDSARIVEEPDTPVQNQDQGLDSARVEEEPSTPVQMYPNFASAALTSAARRFTDVNNHSLSSASQEQPQSTNRKRHLPPPYGSLDGVPPSKAPAKVVNGSTFQEIPGPPLQQSQTNTSSTFTQQGSSSSVSIGGAYIPIAPKQSYVINNSQISPLIMNADDVAGATGATAVLAPQPVVQAVPQQPVAQVQPSMSILGNGNLPSLLNPLILNQQIQVRRLSASPPLCTPYPTSNIPANVISGNTLSGQLIPVPNLNYLPGVSQNITFPIPVNTQWTQPTSNLQLVPATPQTYSPVWTVGQQLNASLRGRLPQ